MLKQDIQNTGGKDTSETASFENKGDVRLMRGVGLGRDVGLTRSTHGAYIACAVRDLLPQCRIHKIVLLAKRLHKTSEFYFTEVYPHARRDA